MRRVPAGRQWTLFALCLSLGTAGVQCDMSSDCSSLGAASLFAYQTCTVAHTSAAKTWWQAADSCNDLPTGGEVGAGHLLHTTESAPVIEMLGASASQFFHTGVFNTDYSGDNKRGWYYMLNSSASSAVAEQLPTFWGWTAPDPNQTPSAGRNQYIRFVTPVNYDVPASHSAPYICQYAKVTDVQMHRVPALDGRRPRADTTLATETGRRSAMHCILACIDRWSASLCRAIAHDAPTGRCVHAAAQATLRAELWLEDTGAHWTVWQLRE